MKRHLSADEEDSPRRRSHDGRKRRRIGCRTQILDLPPEILLRVFALLEVPELMTLDSVSHRFRQLSTDSELWKILFCRRFIEPRARRIPDNRKPSGSTLLQWLEHGETLRDNVKINWKRRYRLQSNWYTGQARLHEVEVARPPTPPVLASVNKGRIFTVDTDSGLRAWSYGSNERQLEAHISVRSGQPTSIATDSSQEESMVAVGFEDGVCEFHQLKNGGFSRLFDYSIPGDCSIASMALSERHLVVMTDDRHIHLSHIANDTGRWSASSIAVLHADSPLHPAALSLRCNSRTVTATIAYSFARLDQGWCIGLQEIQLSREDGTIASRTASNIETSLDSRYHGPGKWEITSRSAFSAPVTAPFSITSDVKTAPISLSYSHPFLLASLADNTIMSYLVQSDGEKLEFSTGRRLFGHTSSITSAEVSNRGKAVSVSAKGDDIRVWELEEMLTTSRAGRTSTPIRPRNTALDVATALAARGNGLGLALQAMKRELAMTRRWVGFDSEQVVVLGERDQRQILACYDFR